MMRIQLSTLLKRLCENPLAEFLSCLPKRCTDVQFVVCDFHMQIACDQSTCWNWCGRKDAAGYGQIYKWGAHRISAALFIGPSQGQYTLHKCDNPSCVNPSHLYYGNQRQNTRDAIDRGRMIPNKGWHHTNDAKAKISARSAGINNPMFGVRLTGENHWNYKGRVPDDVRKKISMALMGNKNYRGGK